MIYDWDTGGETGASSLNIYGLECYDNKNCAMITRVGLRDAYLRVTHDGGYDWYSAVVDTLVTIYDSLGNWVQEVRPRRFWSLSVPTEDFAIAGCDSGYYFISTDGLKNWELKKMDMDQIISHSVFFDGKIGIMGNMTELYVTFDGTESFEEITPEFSNIGGNWFFENLFWASAKTFYITGYDLESDSLFFFRSQDSGRTFERMAYLEHRIRDMYFLDEDLGFAVGGNQYAHGSSWYFKAIYKTTNGGKDWELKLRNGDLPRERLKKVQFIDEQNGIAYGDRWGNLWETSDGGETWVSDSSYNADVVTTVSLIEFVMFSPGEILATAWRGGKIWLKTPSTSVARKEILGEVTISPNPVPRGGSAVISVDIDNPGVYTFSVYSLSGELLESYSEYLHIADNLIEYSPEIPAAGIYYLLIEGMGGKAMIKIGVE